MSTYIIGDLQGCFDSLQALLQKIRFDPEKDRLGFVGDLVNRGPKSLETLRFVSQLKNPLIVLGNHDLHLLALYFANTDEHREIPHTLHEILKAPDCDRLIGFLMEQPFLLRIENGLLCHAGIPPQWSLQEAFLQAKWVHELMQKNPREFFESIYGNEPAIWNNHLTGWDRARYVVNAFTRMRFCTREGKLDLDNKTDVSTHADFQPWFSWNQLHRPIYFGHWASLNGRCEKPHIYALDTGCVWGGKLTAIRLEDQQLLQVDAI